MSSKSVPMGNEAARLRAAMQPGRAVTVASVPDGYFGKALADLASAVDAKPLVFIARDGQRLGQIERANARWLLTKEVAVAMLNGVAWASVVALGTYVWFRQWRISAVIFAAMVVNLIAAAFAGVLVPLGLKRFGVDPAVAGGVIVTTVTDVIGFASLLGLGTWLLL
jgi:magnesium transporter